MLRLVDVAANLFEHEKFADTPAALRRLNDIAFSGDGEPTTYRNFDEIIAACAELKRRHGLDDVKMVLITNASMFHRAARRARAGDPRSQQRRNLGQARSRAPTSISSSSSARRFRFGRFSTTSRPPRKIRPLVIQALFMRIHGEPPPARRAGSLLRPAERNHRRRRQAQARADLHRRPPARRELRRAADERRSRCPRRTRPRSNWIERRAVLRRGDQLNLTQSAKLAKNCE